MIGLVRWLSMRGIKKDVRQSHPAGCRCQTGRSKSQVVKRFCYVKTNAILLRDSVYPSRFVFSFLARHVGRDWTVCYWGLAVSRPALMPKYCSSQTSRSSFNRHAKILEREREDRSLWLYLYGIRVTDIGGKLKSLCDPVYVEFF